MQDGQFFGFASFQGSREPSILHFQVCLQASSMDEVANACQLLLADLSATAKEPDCLPCMQLRNLLWAANGTGFFFLSGNTIKSYDSYRRKTREVCHFFAAP